MFVAILWVIAKAAFWLLVLVAAVVAFFAR